VLLLFSVLPFPGQAAAASIYERFKDIYNTPEKVAELQHTLDEQAKQLEEAGRKAEEYAQNQQELLQQNEAYMRQNQALSSQNTQLLMRMEQLEQEKSARSLLIHWVTLTATAIFGLAILYLMSIRIWRYSVWRRNKHNGGRLHR
jgi:hypothetical protein